MLTESGAKLLDFGLAKVQETHSGPGGLDPAEQSTVAGDLTRAGGVLGTTSYLSPEQARGKPVDSRTDIWSFGCVVYEMLTARRAFPGETQSDVLAAILTREPDYAALPAGAPSPLRKLVRACLEKDVAQRVQNAAPIREILEQTRAARYEAQTSGARLRRWISAAAVIFVVALVAYLITARRREANRNVVSAPRLTQVTFSEGIEQFPAWSPDGLSLAYAAETGPVRKIFLKRLEDGQESQLSRGESDDIQPAWSTDGRAILFVRSREPGRKLEPGDVFGEYEGGDVWSIEVASGRETQLLQEASNPSYAPDGSRIAVDAPWAGPRRIWIVDPLGRNPQQATTDLSEEITHMRPRWSPDGSKIVFENLQRTKFDVRVVDLSTKRLIDVTDDPSLDINPHWSSSGEAIYFSSYRSGGLNVWRVPVDTAGRAAGPLRQLTTGAGQDVELALSADGKRLAFSVLKQNADIWRVPVAPASGSPAGPAEQVIATTREDSRGAWSPDGARIAFNSDRAGDMNIWVYSLQTGQARQVTRGAGGDFQPSWSPDGRRIVFFSTRSGNVDIWAVEVDTGAMSRLTQGGSIDVNPFYSPDGSRIAYQSDQGGRLEAWVMDAGGTGARQLTQAGVVGHFLRWTRDGEGIVFRCNCAGESVTMIVPVEGGQPRPIPNVAGGSHMSFSSDFSLIMDTVRHKSLWVSSALGGNPVKVFEFDDPDVRLDYPVWSQDGRWVMFDRFRPQGGDVWFMEGFEWP